MTNRRAVDTHGLALAPWIAGYDTIGPAYAMAERLSLALAIPLNVLVPEPVMPVKREPTATAGTITTTN